MPAIAQHKPVKREQLLELEQVMFGMTDRQLEIEPRHYFATGLYCRELTIPAGATISGKIHKTEHISIVSKGKIVVATEEGRKIIEAPFTYVAPAGTKRIGHALEDTVWTTVHSSHETDLEKLEAELIAQDFDDYERYLERQYVLEKMS